MPGTDPIRIAVITFALPRDNLLIAEATKLALAPLFPNRGIKLIFCTFEEFDRIVLSRGAEFILGTSGAVTRLSTFGLRPLATLVSKGGPDPNRNEGSAVIVREDHREFQTLGDLKGRTIAASNALSFPGWQIVLGEVAKFGINPNEFFGKTIFTGDARSISDIVKLVLDEKADAGVLRLCAYEQFIERHPEAVGELRILDRRDNVDVACVHSTDLYPGFTMASTELISPEAARRATLALLSMPPTERGARWTIPTNYKSVDALLEAIRVGPSEKLRATMLNELIDDYLTWMLVIALLILGLLFHGWRAEVLARRQGERVRELMEQNLVWHPCSVQHRSRRSQAFLLTNCASPLHRHRFTRRGSPAKFAEVRPIRTAWPKSLTGLPTKHSGRVRLSSVCAPMPKAADWSDPFCRPPM